jgi:glycogen(starch) synthase
MRVLITTDVVGGVWQFTHELAAGLLSEGSSVALVSFGGEPSEEQCGECARLSSQYRDTFVYENSCAPLEWMQENEGAYHEPAPMLIRMIKEFDAEILHSNQFCFGALPVDIPKVITAHSDVLSWAEACRGEPLENSRWLRQYCRLVTDGLNGAAAIVAPTRWMLNALRRNFPLRARCEVIPNGRTLADAVSPVRHLRAVVAGRLWDEAKDIRMLGDVNSPIAFLAAGGTQQSGARGPQYLRGVTLLGRRKNEELLRLFRESAIYICTSRYEPFGLAPLEAALCGCAVLARDIDSLREVWQDGALYFSDAASLSTLLNEMALSPECLQAAQDRSRKRAEWFTAGRMIGAYRAQFAKSVSELGTRTYAA